MAYLKTHSGEYVLFFSRLLKQIQVYGWCVCVFLSFNVLVLGVWRWGRGKSEVYMFEEYLKTC